MEDILSRFLLHVDCPYKQKKPDDNLDATKRMNGTISDSFAENYVPYLLPQLPASVYFNLDFFAKQNEDIAGALI